MNVLTMFVTVILAAFTFALPKKYFVIPFIVAACFVPTDQRVVISGLDFTVLRILVAAGIFRILIFGESVRIRWNRFDKVLLLWAVYGSIIYTLRISTAEAAVNRLGVIFDVLGLYWIFRQRIRTWTDIKFVFSSLAICMIFLAPLVMVELATRSNPFSALGTVVTGVRQERLRCQAAFPHSIMLGLFCATQIPFFIAMTKNSKNKTLFFTAILAGLFITFATASTTPILVFAAGVFLTASFKYRKNTGWIFKITLITLLVLHFVMDAPVWHLLARINIIGGSTGWHRYNLINQAMLHLNEWIFMGSSSSAHWGFGLEDVTNQFILEGLRGGLPAMLIFIAMIFIGMKSILNFSLTADDPDKRFLAWCCLATMAAHCIAFFGVSYFGQMTMLWYMTLAVVGLLVEYQNCIVAYRSPVAADNYYSIARA